MEKVQRKSIIAFGLKLTKAKVIWKNTGMATMCVLILLKLCFQNLKNMTLSKRVRLGVPYVRVALGTRVCEELTPPYSRLRTFAFHYFLFSRKAESESDYSHRTKRPFQVPDFAAFLALRAARSASFCARNSPSCMMRSNCSG